MKIGIITIHNSSNFGAVLQAYALQNFLKKYFEDVEIINYKNPFIMKGLDVIRHGMSLRECYYTLYDLLHFKSRKITRDKFKFFFKHYLILSELVTKKELLKKYNDKYNVYISGSDQIWNPNVTNGKVDPVYFCKMASDNKRIISYASSFGSYKFDNKKEVELIGELLKRYDCISTRENDYIPIMKELFEVKAQQVLDPVLLLDKEMWRHLVKNKNENGKYLVVYAMTKIDILIKYSIKTAKKYNLKILVIGIYRRSTVYENVDIHYINKIGPIEFVELFYYAQGIVTNSFHGTAFAVNFNKPLIVIGNAKSMNRIRCLLENIDLTSCIFTQEMEPIFNVDFKVSNEKLKELRKHSIDFLINSINN